MVVRRSDNLVMRRDVWVIVGIVESAALIGYQVSVSLLSLEVATPTNKCIHSTLSSVREEVRPRCGSAPHKWFLVMCSSPFMQLAEHITALRAWCTRYLAW